MKEKTTQEIIDYFEDNPRGLLLDKNKKIIPPSVARWCDGLYSFFNIIEFDKLLVYDEDTGAYTENAEPIIKKLLEEYFKDNINSYLVAEVIKHLQRMWGVHFRELNKYNNLINLKNGVYDLNDNTIKPHSQEYMFSYVIPITYNADAKCNKILDFLAEITDNPHDYITLIESLAYLFVPGYPIRKAFMLVGEGRNGKSTFLSLIEKILNRDNVSFEKLDMLCRDANYVSNIAGKFANTGYDLPKKALTDVAVFKSLTTYDFITGHKKYVQEGFEFQSRAKLFFATNQIPYADEDTDAFFSRWIIIKFNKQFADNPHILEDISTETEIAGLFNLLIPVVKKLTTQYKFTYAEEVDKVRTTYLKSANPIKLFAEDCLINEGSEAKTLIYAKYTDYCNAYNLPTKNEVWFWKELRHFINFTTQQEGREKVRFAVGISIKPDGTVDKEVEDIKGPENISINEYCKDLDIAGQEILKHAIIPQKKEKEVVNMPENKIIVPENKVLCPRCAKPVSAIYETGYGLICADCLTEIQHSQEIE